MSDNLLAWLTTAMDAAKRDAEAATPGPWNPEAPLLSDVVTSALLGRVADCSVGTGYRPQSLPDARHIARHDPAAVLRRIAADRKLIADLLDERHKVEGDCWYTCAAATAERDGETTCDDDRLGGPCDCGRDTRVERRLRILAEGYGRTEPHADLPS